MTGAVVGVSDHGGWAVFVTVARDGTILDRRRAELVDDRLPALPHHHDAQKLPIADAVTLVERVRDSAERHAALAFGALASAVPNIASIALRNRQVLPATIPERLTDYRARNVADWAMYRNALASAAQARGWATYWYDPKTVFDAAARALNVADLETLFLTVRRNIGPPWNTDHKLAVAASIVATRAPETVGESPAIEGSA